MRNATADFVGLSNFPLFGPQGKHHGCEDCLVIDFVPTRSPPPRDASAHRKQVRLSRILTKGAANSYLRYAFDTLHTWVMVLKVGLEPTRLAATDFESVKSTNSIIRAYKRTLGAAVSPAASPTLRGILEGFFKVKSYALKLCFSSFFICGS